MDTTVPFGVSDETSSLADSAYELISSTDGESQDGRGTESVADSLDVYPRVDDVHSLSGNDAGYDDDDVGEESASENDEGADNEPSATTPSHSRVYAVRNGQEDGPADRRSSQTDSIQYAEHVLGSPSTQSLSNLEYDSSGDGGSGSTPLVHSIEFSESDICLDKVSVKHTIRDFGEAESAAIAAAMHITDPPRRLAATIRQTMSHHCLSTREPLKVLYVGSEAGYNDIMYKISSALLASASHNRSSPGSENHSSTPGIYNIMPISSFGSSKVPEIDEIQLMGVSDYYIKVERCTEADSTAFDESSTNDTVYSIKLENEKTYVSVFSPRGSVVRPQWSLPHVAVFYVSGNDDDRAEKTRNDAWEFMTRHAVPSIFISHAQSFSRPGGTGRWRDFVDQAAVHLCLESRDPERLIVPERLPIDLVSFLNIDARQMNRNLAYLTGLHEPSKIVARVSEADDLLEEGYLAGAAMAVRFLREGNYSRTELSRTAGDIGGQLGVGRLLTMAIAAISALMWSYIILYIPFMSATSAGHQSVVAATMSASPSSSVTGTAAGSFPSASPSATTSTSACFVPSLTPTVTISLTSTTTVQLPVSESSSSAVPFGGYLTDRANRQNSASPSKSEIKRTGCSIHVYSNHEVLVKVPSGTKTTWLAKGAIDIDVWRGQELLKSRLSTTDEGIIIEINKKDAYGVMNVSIVTTRRPKINETFAVDFGKPTLLRALEIGAEMWLDSARTVASTWRDAAVHADGIVHPYIDQVADHLPTTQDVVQSAALAAAATAASLADAMDSMKHAGQTVYSVASRATQDLKEQVGVSMEGVVDSVMKDARAVLDRGLLPLDDVRDNMRLTVLRAQIASKLWWMQVNGHQAEHADYKAKAAVFLHEAETAAKAKAKAKAQTGGQGGSGDRSNCQGWQAEKFAWGRSFGSGLWKTTPAREPNGKWKFMGREVRG